MSAAPILVLFRCSSNIGVSIAEAFKAKRLALVSRESRWDACYEGKKGSCTCEVLYQAVEAEGTGALARDICGRCVCCISGLDKLPGQEENGLIAE
jgi:hypothetical protein